MLRRLCEIDRGCEARVGSKAARLAELSQLGFNVPDGIVVSTDAYDEFLRINRLLPRLARWLDGMDVSEPHALEKVAGEIRESYESAILPAHLVEGIFALMANSGAGSLAVRSSATCEDLPGATFAGQYDSFLNVAVPDVALYLKRCFASLFNARAILYRSLKGMKQDAAMAVLLQEMVSADFAGVLFTSSPSSPSSIILELAPGIGEQVLSGTVSPNRYLIHRADLRIKMAHEVYRFERGRLIELAALGLGIEEHFGVPQDIEFAITGDDIHILQARPSPSRN